MIVKPKAIAIAPIESPVAVNHLFIGRKHGLQVSKGKNRTVVDGPSIAPLYQRKGNHISGSRASVASSADRSSTSTLEPEDEVYSDSNNSRVSVTPDSSPNLSPTHQSGESGQGTPTHGQGVAGEDGGADLIALDDVEDENPNTPPHQSTVCQTDAKAKDSAAEDDIAKIEELSPGVDSNCNTIGGKDSTQKNDGNSVSETGKVEEAEHSMTERLYPQLQKQREATRAELSHAPCNTSTPVKNCNVKATLLEVASGMQPAQNGVLSAHSTTTSDVVSDKNAQYVAKLTYKSHKVAQSQREVGSSNTGGSVLSPISRKPPKLFNPFPSQHVTNRRIENGIKLGLYSAKNLPKFETGIIRSPDISSISRAQHNACIHRQYMAEVKGQSKSAKSWWYMSTFSHAVYTYSW